MDTLTKHVREITRAAFARHGFAQAEVVTGWAEIVGADLAAVSAPERIRWPRGSGEDAQKQGGTLVIRAAPGRALEIQYEASRIIGRINSYFGYGAVAQIKVMQSAELMPRRPGSLPQGELNPEQKQELETVQDESLKAALERLGQGISAARKSSPQKK